MKALSLTILLIWLGVLGSGCSTPSEGNDTQAKANARPPVSVEAITAVAGNLADSVEVVGSLSPKSEVEIRSEYSGIVTEVFVTEWVKVKKGDLLARMDTREWNLTVQKAKAGFEMAKAGSLQAKVGNDRAEREYQRLLKLKEAGLATQQMLDEAASAREAAAAAVNAATAQAKAAEEDLHHAETLLTKADIRSPIDGVVAMCGINAGDLFQSMGAPSAMFRIVDNRLLNLTVSVPSAKIGAVKTGQTLTFTTDAHPDRTFEGQVKFINPTVDEVNRSVKLIAEVANPDDTLKSGMFIKGQIITGSRANVVQVPRTALTNWDVAQKKGELFVIDGEQARQRAVQTGISFNGTIEIASGLAPGEQVITRGNFNVRDGDRVTITAAEGA